MNSKRHRIGTRIILVTSLMLMLMSLVVNHASVSANTDQAPLEEYIGQSEAHEQKNENEKAATCPLNSVQEPQELREASDVEFARFKQLVQESKQYDSFKDFLAQDQKDFELTEDIVTTVVDKKHVTVSFAVKGGAGYSFFGAVVDYTSGEILSTRSGLHAHKGDNIEAIYHNNGELLSHLEIAQTGEIVDGFVIDEHGNKLDANELQSEFLSCLNSCLSGMGVPMWIISAISVGCGVVCAGTAGLGCWVCLYAAAGGLSGTLGWCFGVCS